MPVPHHSSFFTGRMPFLPPNQQRQSTEGKVIKTSRRPINSSELPQFRLLLTCAFINYIKYYIFKYDTTTMHGYSPLTLAGTGDPAIVHQESQYPPPPDFVQLNWVADFGRQSVPLQQTILHANQHNSQFFK